MLSDFQIGGEKKRKSLPALKPDRLGGCSVGQIAVFGSQACTWAEGKEFLRTLHPPLTGGTNSILVSPEAGVVAAPGRQLPP